MLKFGLNDLSWPGQFNFANYACSSVTLFTHGSHLILFPFQIPSIFSLKSSVSLSTWAPLPTDFSLLLLIISGLNFISLSLRSLQGFPSGASVRNLPANAGDRREVGSIPRWERCPGGEQGNPFQYSCLENPMDRGAWWAIVHRVAKSWTWLRQLSLEGTRSLQG